MAVIAALLQPFSGFAFGVTLDCVHRPRGLAYWCCAAYLLVGIAPAKA